jgi:hypothetical protein
MRLRRRYLEAHWALFARYLAHTDHPILIGPWRSEVGFEVLYWIPFLNHFRETLQIDPNRLIALGRGGSAAWYGTAGHGDLYEHLPLEAVRALSVQASQQTGSIKQHDAPAWERHVCALAATSLGLSKYAVLSPRWMYQLLRPFWEGDQPLKWLDARLLHHAQMKPPALDPVIAKQLPERFIAMRWYARPTWPLKEDLLLWTRKLVEATARHMPVVLVTSGMHTDDHADMSVGNIPNVLSLKDFAPQTPLDNLAIQSAVIAKAQGYVGTYGGMSQLAMRFGVPTLALYDQFGQTAPAHLALTHHLSLKSGVPFVATTPKSLDLLLPLIVNSGQKMPFVHQAETP